MKSTPKFYSEPTRDPSFLATQKKWYSRLQKEGFNDIEDWTIGGFELISECYRPKPEGGQLSGYISNVKARDGSLTKNVNIKKETAEKGGRPLKKWSGISALYITATQPPGQVVSSFPQSVYAEEEEFQNHPEFQDLCLRLCQHGNSRLTAKLVRSIWVDYCEGKTIRQSEVTYKVSDTTVFRVIQTVTEWMKLMDTRPQIMEADEMPPSTTIFVRPMNIETDLPMIYASWRNALWYDEARDERLASEFFSQATQSIKKMISDRNTAVQIACSKEDPDFIAGYSVMTGTELQWVYVKIAYRKQGIGRILAKGAKTYADPMTRVGVKILEELRKKENADGKKEESSKH